MVSGFLDKKDDNKKAPILVTGADGYIAGVLVRELLWKGHLVHATVLDLKAPQVDDLKKIAAAADKSSSSKAGGASIKFFTANLLEPGSFHEAMQGCRIVIHTASPFMMRHGIDPQRDLVDPAVQGTVNVLETANQTPTVKRIIQTSSVGAIYADAIDTYAAPGNILTEDIWNTTSTLNHQPYFLSKTLSEQKAWEMAQAQSQWQLVTLHPSHVLGPGLRYHQHSESFRTLHKLGGGHFSMWTGCPNVAMPVVDVRDVAAAHVTAALEDVDIPSGRYILSATTNTTLPQLAGWLRQKYPHYPIAGTTCPLPKHLLALVVPFCRQGVDALTCWNNVDVKINLDNTKSKTVLGLEYRDPAITLQEMYQQMIDAGAVQPGPRPELVGASLAILTLAIALGVYCQLFWLK